MERARKVRTAATFLAASGSRQRPPNARGELSGGEAAARSRGPRRVLKAVAAPRRRAHGNLRVSSTGEADFTQLFLDLNREGAGSSCSV